MLQAQVESCSRAEFQNVQPTAAHTSIRKWVQECAALTQPDSVVWMDGFKAEKDALLGQGVAEGTFIRLDQESQPGVHLHRGNQHDVARSEHLTYICTPSKDGGGPTNNWMDPATAYAKLRGLFCGSMKGRTMYVVPFVMGPTGSPLARLGVEITDSLYVVVNLGIMTRMGDVAWKQLGFCQEWTRCLHSSGHVNSDQRYICHFPQDNTIWSFGSGYGGNALLGKKCLAPHMASHLGNQQNWILPYADAGEAGSIDVQAFAAIQRIPTLLEQLLAVMSKPPAAPPRVNVRGESGGDDEDDLRQLWRQLTPEQRSILRFIWKEGDNVLNYALIAANMTVPRLAEVVTVLSDVLKEAKRAAAQYDVKTFQSMMKDKAR